MSVRTVLRILWPVLLTGIYSSALATTAFSSLFSNNMILQRGVSVHVWGTAGEGESVTVTFNGQTVVGVGDASNSWSVTLSPMSALTTGTSLSAQSANNMVSYTNVVVGDIYLCSGQSNMDSVALSACTPNGTYDAANSNFPNIRLLYVNHNIQATPLADSAFAPGVWRTCTSSTNASFISSFSGLGYYFGRKLYENQNGNVPIGLIHSAYYAMPIEVFMSLEAVMADPAMALAIPKLPFSTAYGDSTPTGVYNGMIAPLTKFNIAGAVWNQGETNQGNSSGDGINPHGWLPSTEYKTMLPTLIKDWRRKWNSNFPFYIIQMPNISNLNTATDPCTYWGGTEPWNCVASGLADVRFGEFNTLKMPLTGMSVNFDLNAGAMLCDSNLSYHPKNKDDFANRIAPWAVNQIYGQSVPYTFTGPIYHDYEVQGAAVVLHFTFPNGGSGFATSNAQPVTGFQISSASSPSYFVWATAVTSTGDSVTVTSPSVTSPGFVRYAWSDNPRDPNGPQMNLTDASGYLASPFQTYNFSDMIVTANGGATIPDMNLVPSTSNGSDLGSGGLCQAITQTFTIINNATAKAPLTLTGGTTLVRVSGTNASDFTVVTQPSTSTLAPGSSTNFQVSFMPGAVGSRTAVLQIPCNTPEKTPYTIYLQATGVDNCTPTFTPTFTPTGTWYTATPTLTKTPTMTMTITMTPAFAVTMIDNFDDAAGRGPAATHSNLWGQPWQVSAATGSSINAAYFSPGASGSANAVSVYGNLGSGGWLNYLTFLEASQAPFNAAAAGFTGIQFWIYGDGGQYRPQIITQNVTTGDYYGMNITPAAGTWTFVQIPFSSMTQSGWGKISTIPINPTANDVTGLKFDTLTADAFAYLLDELSFFGPLPTATPTGTWYTATGTPTQTRTPTVTPTPTPTGTWFTATPTATNLPDTATYPFETTNPWAYIGNAVTGMALSTDHVYRGSSALAVTFGSSPNYGDVGIEPITANIAGGGITVHLWVPSDIPANPTAFIYVKSGTAWCWQVGPSVTLTAGGWTDVTFNESNMSAQSCGASLSLLQGFGVQLQTSATWSGVFYIDSVDLSGASTSPTLTPTASPTRTVSATPTATPTGTWFTPTMTPTGATDTTTYPFETGTMSWSTVYHAVTGTSKVTTPVYMGSGALAVTFDTSNTEGEIGVQPPSVTNIVGGTITAHIWVPSDIPAGSVADVFVKSNSSTWCWQNGVTVTLNPGAWTTLTFDASNVFSTQGTSPDLTAVQAIGVQLQVASSWSGVFYVDSVNIVAGSSASTPTATLTWTGTLGATASFTQTNTPSTTATNTWSATSTWTQTATPTATSTMTRTFTATYTKTDTLTWTATATDTPTVTLTPTETDTPTITPTPAGGLDVAFPNPNDGLVPVRFCHWINQTADEVVLKIYTVSGRKIYEQPCVDESGGAVSAGQHCYQLDWSQARLNLSNGLYYFVLQEIGGANAKKTMKVFINR